MRSDRDIRARLVQALKAGFKTEELHQLIRYNLDEEPEIILRNGTLLQQIDDLVAYSFRHGRVRDLASAILELRPDTAQVTSNAQSILSQLDADDALRAARPDARALPAAAEPVGLEITHDDTLWWNDRAVLITGRKARLATGRLFNNSDKTHEISVVALGIDNRWLTTEPSAFRLEPRTEERFGIWAAIPKKVAGRRRTVTFRVKCRDDDVDLESRPLTVHLIALTDIFGYVVVPAFFLIALLGIVWWLILR